MSDNLPVESKDEFDEIFFATHGVGHDPVSADESILNSLDNSNPTWQEIEFVRMYFREGNITDAYMKAFSLNGTEYSRRDYYTRLAKRLLERPRVAKKLDEYQRKAQAMADEDIANLVYELNEDRKLARTLGQPSAAIAATKAKANLLGLEQNTSSSMNIVLDLSDEQKSNLLGRIGQRLVDKSKPDNKIIDADYEDVSSE